VLEISTSTSTKQFYVFYDEWTGAISNITTVLDHESSNPHIVTDSDIIEQIVKGYRNENNYIVSFDNDNNFDVIEKGSTLRLRSSEKSLCQLPRSRTTEWDIKVVVYAGNSKLVVEVNPEAIRKLSSMTFNKHIIVDDQNDLSLYIVKYNSPDYLVATIDIDAQELLDNGNVIYDIKNIRQHISLSDIGILTRRCFKNYYMEVFNSSLNIVQQSLVKNLSYLNRTCERDLKYSHISIAQHDDIVTFSTKLSSGELADIGLHEDKILLHATGSTPDQYYGSIPLNIRDLKTKKQCKVKIQGKLSDFFLWHKKHKVIFSIKKEPTHE
jgi:hypothetical protein